LEKIIELEHVYVKKDGNVILDDISLSIYKNDFLALIGSNGSGKTTLLKVLAGVIKPNHGEIFLPSNNKNPKIGYLPQKIPVILNSPVTVREIIETGINSSFIFSNDVSREKIMKVSKDIGIDKSLDKKIIELSGGQIQLVFLARAIVDSPDIIILDEPSSSIDMKTQVKIFNILDILHRKKIPIIFSSHDTFAITKSVNRLACINKRLDFHGKVQDFLSDEHLTKSYGYNAKIISHGDHQ
tara:strand:+ start:132 stop:854 length:723 start_codon:yes stop_codon:yes gene_type:complete